MIRHSQQTIYFEARSLSTGERVSGIAVTASLSKDGGTDSASTNGVTEIGTLGVYQLTLTAQETNCNTAAVILSTPTEGVFLPLIALEFDDLSALATSSSVSAIQESVDALPTAAEITNGVATAASVTELSTAISALPSSVWSYTVSGLSGMDAEATLKGVYLSTSTADTVPTASEVAQAVWTCQKLSSINTNSYGYHITQLPTSGYIGGLVWDESIAPHHAGSGTFGRYLYDALKTATFATPVEMADILTAVSTIPTAAETADAVCDESLSGHGTSGSLGATLSSVATATSSTEIAATVSDIETAVSTVNETVNGIQTDIITIRSNVSAISGYTDELEGMVEDLPTASGIAAAVWSSGSRTLTDTDLSGLESALASITALLGHWTCTADTLTTYDTSGNALASYSLTRDTSGNITSISEAAG